ncbi:MAG: GLUG motif-containing protein, partial [Thermoplasmata archaeon]
ADDGGPKWSPDGKQIAFVSDRDNNYEIYIMDLNGTDDDPVHIKRLTNNPSSDIFPSWSPDGKQIAFVSDRTGNNEIYIMETDGEGGEPIGLTSNSSDNILPSFSPDGSWIGFSSSNTTGGGWIGGLIGVNSAYVSCTYASGAVSGENYIGGHVGSNDKGTVENSYATGAVTRIPGSIDTEFGGFVGYNDQGKVINCYSTGFVEAVDGVPLTENGFSGGIVTDGNYEMKGNFWDIDTSKQENTACNAKGSNTVEMMTQLMFTEARYDFIDIWWMIDGNTRPFLQMEWSTEIHNSHQLQMISMSLSEEYVLMCDIDLRGYLTDASRMWGTNFTTGGGFVPVGNDTNRFTGSLDGQNYTITGSYIDRPSTDYIGLFGAMDTGGEVSDVGVIDADVSGYWYVGGLVGRNEGTVNNSYATGDVSGTERVGGLVGRNEGTVNNSYATGNVSGNNEVGGLMGLNSGTVENSYATGNVSGYRYVGGFVGVNWQGTVENSYSTENVSGFRYVGGFVGLNDYGMVLNSYATGTVTRNSGSTFTYFGGFVGRNSQGKIINCYSTGSVHYENADDPTNKGFAGYVDTGGDYEMSGNFWDVETSEQTSTAGNATGKTTAEMKKRATFTDVCWDFNNIWHILEELSYPLLQYQPMPTGSGTPEDPYWIYDTWDLQNMNSDINAHYALASDINASETSGWNDGAGFLPIGDNNNMFVGSLDGRYHTITGLYINRPTSWYVGLFGYVGIWGEIRNVGLVDNNVSGGGRVGGIAGTNYGVVSNTYASGEVSGDDFVGGLVGYNLPGTVENSYTTANVSGESSVGGLLGLNFRGEIFNSYATGDVTRWSSSTDTSFGGFIGYNDQGKIIDCYSTGSIHYEGATDPTDKGFVGNVDTGGDYEMAGSFWNADTSGQTSTAGNATGKTTAEMMDITTFSFIGWDIAYIWEHDDEMWYIDHGQDYPHLYWEEYPNPSTIELSLYTNVESDGWNFISSHLGPVDTSLTSILANIEDDYDRVMYYDGANDEWLTYIPGRPEHFNDLDKWNHSMGIWIRMTENATLTVEGHTPISTDITLYPGWNMVGYPSDTIRWASEILPSEVTKIGTFSQYEPYNIVYFTDLSIVSLGPDNGYWLYNDADYTITWAVDY